MMKISAVPGSRNPGSAERCEGWRTPSRARLLDCFSRRRERSRGSGQGGGAVADVNP
jgi:hypothetical protein